MNRVAKLISVSLVFLISALAFLMALCACSSSSVPALNKDASIKTKWGAVLQFKVNSDWNENSPSSYDSSYYGSYGNESGNEFVSISITNPNDSSYKYDSSSTYSDWLSTEEEYYSRSAQDQADWYKRNVTGQYYDAEFANPNKYPDFTDYSMEEIGNKNVDGTDFRLYKQSYTSTYSDSYIQELKEKNPDNELKNPMQYTSYIAVVKDGTHDMEITATSDALLNSFLDTLSIKW